MAINFSDLTKKMDLQGLMKNVKSMVNPDAKTPQPVDANDALGLKMAELSLSLQSVSKIFAEQAQQLEQANQLLMEMDALLKAKMAEAPKAAEKPAAETKSEDSSSTENQ